MPLSDDYIPKFCIFWGPYSWLFHAKFYLCHFCGGEKLKIWLVNNLNTGGCPMGNPAGTALGACHIKIPQSSTVHFS